MPIDVYAPEGTFPQERGTEVLRLLTECLLKWTDASDLPIARNNTVAYLHVLPHAYVVAGGTPSSIVRIDVKLPEVVLSTIERRRGFIADATEIVGAVSVGGRDVERTLITVSNAVDGGWGIGGRAITNAELDDL